MFSESSLTLRVYFQTKMSYIHICVSVIINSVMTHLIIIVIIHVYGILGKPYDTTDDMLA